ncbi:hypothetical protein SAMN04488066_1252 [Halorubrum aquaticum]|uniref:DUF8059 domain-containing protein n=1 Tax=Halorubrum aquaticum TaxID=387340 RepID=A0A1I3CM62_9EURY|nr:hypothetical protein [Halorubrum aquaticum]SFH75577.1 hypothetical protein SAMN04488066_1252 [Halorubrum aquaticum]
MTRALKGSGFLGLAVMMAVGLHQFVIVAGGSAVPPWMIGGHAHLGVLSILAIVMGFAVPALGVTGTTRTAVTGLFIAGQWGIPGIVWLGEGFGLTFLMPTGFLWGGALIVSMLIMFYYSVTQPSDAAGGGSASFAPGDD